MKQFLNTLYVMTEGTYLSLDHDTLKIEVERESKNHIPLHHLGSIVCFGHVMMTPFLIHRCAEDGRTLLLLDRNGNFKARMVGSTRGNVLLRMAQYEAQKDGVKTAAIARNIVAGKLKNCRYILLRAAREGIDEQKTLRLRKASDAISQAVFKLKDVGLEEIRGLEGESAFTYFSTFGDMMLKDAESFRMTLRSRRPPKDRINALLSYLYTLLLHDCISGLECVGLDPQVGFLHSVRPGRPSLALDLMEEFRPILADRLTLTLINRGQITPSDFEPREGGAVYLNEEGRKTVAVAYQKKKQEEVKHPLFQEKASYGLLPHIQARLLARYIRGELEGYPPFLIS